MIKSAPLILPLLAALSGLMPRGCEDTEARRRAEAEEALAVATQRFQELAGPVVDPASEAFEPRQAELLDLVGRLDSIRDAEGELGAAAAMVHAAVLRELAGMSLARAQRIEAESGRLRFLGLRMVDAASRLHARAAGQASIDFQQHQEILEQRGEEARQRLEQYSQQIADLDGPISDLQQQNTEDRDEIDRLTRDAGQRRRDAADRGYADGFTLFEEAVRLERDADRLENRIAMRDLDLQYELSPEMQLSELRAESASAMVEALELSGQETDAFAGATASDIETTREAIAGLADRIGTIVQQLDSSINGPLQEDLEQAVSYLDRAVGQVGRATRELRGAEAASAHLATARLQTLRGRAHWTRGRALTDQLSLLERVADAEVVFGDFPAALLDLGQIRTARDESYAQAAEALGLAQESLEKVTSGVAGNAVAALQAQIGRALATLTAEPGALPLELPSISPPAPGAAEAPPAGAGGRGLATPEEVVARITDLGQSPEDIQSMLDLCYTSDPEARQMLEVIPTVVEAMERISGAFTEKFGEPSGMMAQSPVGQMLPPVEQLTEIERTEDTVIYGFTDPTGEQDQITIGKHDGLWYVDMDDIVQDAGPGGAPMFMGLASAISDLADDLEQRIRGGEFATAAEAEAMIGQELMQAMMRGMGMPEGFEMPGGAMPPGGGP